MTLKEIRLPWPVFLALIVIIAIGYLGAAIAITECVR